MDEEQDQEKLDRVIGRFFEIHAEDLRMSERGGQRLPYSVIYHESMLGWLETIRPEAGEALRLAAACQHIRRWTIPRDRYPEGKLAYKKWRHDLAIFHGDEAARVLSEAGYGEEMVARVRALLLKTGLKEDAEVQALEDVACLVFLENEFAAFAAKHDEEKIAVILRKTWKKMSPRGHEEALKLVGRLPEDLRTVVVRALG